MRSVYLGARFMRNLTKHGGEVSQICDDVPKFSPDEGAELLENGISQIKKVVPDIEIYELAGLVVGSILTVTFDRHLPGLQADWRNSLH